MSLKVWLPLMGTLENKGISNITVTNVGTTVDASAGKISASCQKFTRASTPNNYLRLPPILSDSEFSFCCWFKTGDITVNQCLLSQRTAVDATGFTIFYMGATTGANSDTIRFDDGTSLNSTGKISSANTWYHIACVRTATQKLIYINGVLSGSGTSSTPTTINNNYLLIGGSQNDAAGSAPNGNGLSGYLQDVRIYNHSLSALEIKEIAQGLILHYPLNLLSNNIMPGTNSMPIGSWPSTTGWALGNWTLQSGGNGTARVIAANDLPNPKLTQYWTIENNTSGNRDHGMAINPRSIEGQYYTLSLYARGTGTLQLRVYGNSAAQKTKTFTLTSDWKYYTYTYSASTTMANYNCTLLCGVKGAGAVDMCGIKLEYGQTATPWEPHINDLGDNIRNIIDCSGYGHNTITTATYPYFLPNSPRYDQCYYIPNGNDYNISLSGLSLFRNDPITVSVWFKSNYSYSDTYSKKIISYNNLFNLTLAGVTNAGISFNYSTYTISQSININILDNNWHMLTFTYDRNNIKYYLDGELAATYAATAASRVALSNDLIIGGNTEETACYKTYLSDLRIYCTSLLDNDVKMLYNTSMRIDKNHNVHSREFVETQQNLMAATELARAAGNGFKTSVGLYRYSQANCQVTCTQNGYRIYRPPNISSSSNNMFGGLLLLNSTTYSIHEYNPSIDNIFGLIDGHTYVWVFKVSGQSSTAPKLGITNYTGYESNSTRGLNPAPTSIISHNISASFIGEKEIYYQFTISDSVVKTCKQSYSDFVKDKQYMAYRDFIWRWDYVSTGTLGTDIYVSNIRLYDITELPKFQIDKIGMIEETCLYEEKYGAKIQRDGELLLTQAIEC